MIFVTVIPVMCVDSWDKVLILLSSNWQNQGKRDIILQPYLLSAYSPLSFSNNINTWFSFRTALNIN